MCLRSGKQNMVYNVQFTEKCLTDIEEACRYVRKVLKEDEFSVRFRAKIMNRVKFLAISPEMYAIIPKIRNEKNVYRRIVIDNFVLLYTVDREKKTVYIAHLYYGGKDYIESLF